jgi:hypothetical protein
MKAFNLIPKQGSFRKASKFIRENPSLDHPAYLRLFIKKYGKKITTDKFTEILVRLFDIVDDD